MGGDIGNDTESGGEDEDEYEIVTIAENVSYLQPLIMMLAMIHTFIAFAVMVAYYTLKVSMGHVVIQDNTNTDFCANKIEIELSHKCIHIFLQIKFITIPKFWFCYPLY